MELVRRLALPRHVPKTFEESQFWLEVELVEELRRERWDRGCQGLMDGIDDGTDIGVTRIEAMLHGGEPRNCAPYHIEALTKHIQILTWAITICETSLQVLHGVKIHVAMLLTSIDRLLSNAELWSDTLARARMLRWTKMRIADGRKVIYRRQLLRGVLERMEYSYAHNIWRARALASRPMETFKQWKHLPHIVFDAGLTPMPGQTVRPGRSSLLINRTLPQGAWYLLSRWQEDNEKRADELQEVVGDPSNVDSERAQEDSIYTMQHSSPDGGRIGTQVIWPHGNMMHEALVIEPGLRVCARPDLTELAAALARFPDGSTGEFAPPLGYRYVRSQEVIPPVARDQLIERLEKSEGREGWTIERI